jgi:hypothetical protein
MRCAKKGTSLFLLCDYKRTQTNLKGIYIMEKLFEYISADQKDDKSAFDEVMLLGKNMIEAIMGDDGIVIPLNSRAYFATAKYFISFLPGLSEDDEKKYKKAILDEFWNAKYERSDEMLDYGLGERERIAIGVSMQTAYGYCDTENEIMECGPDYLSGDENCNVLFPNAPILQVFYSERADYIEKMLEKKELVFSELCDMDSFGVGIKIDGKQIDNVNSLIECVQSKRKCGISEAVVEAALIYVEGYLNGRKEDN